MALTKEDLRLYVCEELGGGVWNVELTPAQIDRAINDTLELYSRHMPIQAYAGVNISPNQNRYEFPNMDLGFGVVHVDFVEPDPKPSSIFYASLLDVAPIRTVQFTDYDLFLRWRKTFMKVTSVEPEWLWDEQLRVLWIYNPISDYKATMYYYLPHTLETVPLVHERWFKDYLLGRSKYMLGLNRSKFQGAVPGPSKDINTDGQELKSEGKEEMERYREEIFSMQADPVPLWA